MLSPTKKEQELNRIHYVYPKKEVFVPPKIDGKLMEQRVKQVTKESYVRKQSNIRDLEFERPKVETAQVLNVYQNPNNLYFYSQK